MKNIWRLLLALILILSSLPLFDSVAVASSSPTFWIDNPYVYGGNPYIGQLHVHTTNSDGSWNVTTALETYIANGYSFVAITDHDFVTPDPGTTNITYIMGSEDYISGLGNHAVSIGISDQVDSYVNQEIFNTNIANDGLTALAHPNWSGAIWSEAEIAATDNISMAEVFNGVTQDMEGSGNGEDKWDYAISNPNLRKVWGVATDDAHGPSNANKGYVVAYAASTNCEDILDALRKGNFYSSNGTSISTIMATTTSITVTVPIASTIVWKTQGGVVVQTNSGVLTSTYTATGAEDYVRAVVTQDGTSKTAWTNPFFINKYRKVMSFTPSGIISSVTDFTVRVELNASNFNFSTAYSDGSDVRFADSDELTTLESEIEWYDSANNTARFWVKVPSIATSNYTDCIYMYSDGASRVPYPSNKYRTWGSYEAVHLCENINDWTGTNMQTDNITVKEGYYSVNDTIPVIIGNTYTITCNQTGTWDLSDNSSLSMWFRSSSSANTSFASFQTYLYDAAGNYKSWEMAFYGGSWTNFAFNPSQLCSTVSVIPPDVSAIDAIAISIVPTANTTYFFNIDDLEIRKGPVTVFHFNEMTGDMTFDSSKYSHNGTFSYNITSPTWNNYALEFNSDNEFLYVGSNSGDPYGHSGIYQFYGAVTLSTWVYPYSIGEWSSGSYIIGKNNGIIISTSTFNRFNSQFNTISGGFNVAVQTPANTGPYDKWTYLSGVYDGNNAIACVNSNKYVSSVTGTPMVVNYSAFAGPITIGNDIVSQRGSNSIIDEVRFYNYARNNDENLADYLNMANTLIYFGDATSYPIIDTVTSLPSMTRDGVTSGIFSGNVTSLGINPNILVWFEYGPTSGYGTNTTAMAVNTTGTFTDVIPNGFTPGSSNHFRASGNNTTTYDFGNDGAFDFTMPTVTSSSVASMISGTHAILNSNISSMGAASDTYVFTEWGLTLLYGTTETEVVASTTGTYPFTISGFAPATYYHYHSGVRVGAVYAYSSDEIFRSEKSAVYQLTELVPIVFVAVLLIVSVAMIASGFTVGGLLMLAVSISICIAFLNTIVSILASMW